MSRILVMGAGKFGLKAVRVLSQKKHNRITVVDTDPERCEALIGEGINAVNADGIACLAGSLKDPDPPDWIIPAIPLHVALEWLQTTLPEGAALELLPVPEQVRAQLPNPLEGTAGQVYISYADFMCPEDCPEPGDVCTFTGKARKGILHRTLAQIQHADYMSVVLRSRQIAPGLGGYRSDDLFPTRTRVLAANGPVMLSTACKCHGVIQAFRIT
jgi:hypothetical protein